MCKQCVAIAKELFPNANDQLIKHILWEETSYPIANCETIRKQLKEYVTYLDKQLEEYVTHLEGLSCDAMN